MPRKPKTNPNGANQYLLDPRQKLCWDYYINPKSETFGNGTQSAIKAGYEPDYADQITTVDWFKGRVRKLNMLGKAERNLDEVLDLVVKDKKGRTNPQLLKIKTDTSLAVAKNLGKGDGWTERTEHAVLLHEVSPEELEQANRALIESE